MSTKTLTRVRVKDATLGIVEAVFASHLVDEAGLSIAKADCIDKDGDVTLKGAFTEGQSVVVSAYGHGSWEGRLPVGKGVIREEGDQAIAELKFFMDTTHGLDTFKTVAELSVADLQEWSYSLHDVVAERGKVAGKSVRILRKVGLVKEVSPVLMGAGVETRTLAVKEHKQLDSSLRRLLRAAGRSRFTGWVWLEDYDTDEGFVVYGVDSYDGDERLVQVDFTRTDTSVTLGEAETDVHASAVFLPKQGRQQFSEQVEAVVAAVDSLTARASEVVALRAEKGKSLSDATTEGLARLVASVDQVKALLDEQPATTTTPPDGLQAEFLKFVSLTTQGV